MRFSERYGFKSAREKLQIDSVDMELRNSLWSVLKLQIWDRVYFSRYEGTAILHPSHNPEMTEFCNRFWFSYSKKPLDTIPSSWPPVLEKLRTYFLGCEWYEVYDFLEFVAQNFPFNNKDEFIKQSNLVLEREMSGYRFTGNTIAPITDETEIGEIDLALSDPTATVRAHLKRALELLSDRTNPDYRNSMKESISAVESGDVTQLV